MEVMPSSTGEAGARAPAPGPSRWIARITARSAVLVLACVSGSVHSDDGTYSSIEAEASISRAGVGASFREAAIPLARRGTTGALISRTPRPIPSTRDCRWPDERTLAAVLPVATDRGSHASGIVFATDRVLTAAHAIADGGRFFVRVGEGYRMADLLLLDRTTDVAVLGVDTLGIEPLPISEHAPLERQPVWAVGFPREAGRTTTSGVFQRNREGALHTSAPIDSGQSGGGLLACEHGVFSVLGMLRGFGAYRSGERYVKLDNHSVSVAGATIHRVLANR